MNRLRPASCPHCLHVLIAVEGEPVCPVCQAARLPFPVHELLCTVRVSRDGRRTSLWRDATWQRVADLLTDETLHIHSLVANTRFSRSRLVAGVRSCGTAE